MDLNHAFQKAIKKYFDGSTPEELGKATGKKYRYNKKYFDKVSQDTLGKEINPLKRKTNANKS